MSTTKLIFCFSGIINFAFAVIIDMILKIHTPLTRFNMFAGIVFLFLAVTLGSFQFKKNPYRTGSPFRASSYKKK